MIGVMLLPGVIRKYVNSANAMPHVTFRRLILEEFIGNAVLTEFTSIVGGHHRNGCPSTVFRRVVGFGICMGFIPFSFPASQTKHGGILQLLLMFNTQDIFDDQESPDCQRSRSANSC